MNTYTASASFLNRVAVRCPSMDRDTLFQSARAAMFHLRRRLPVDAERHLLECLPGDARSLSTSRAIEAESHLGARNIEPLDREGFLGRVRREGGLQSDEDAAQVARAVLAAIIEFLPAEEAMHIRTQLPSGMKQLWRETLELEKPASPDMQEFLMIVDDVFSPNNGRQMLRLIDSTVMHFLHRLGFGEEKEMLRYIPEEIRVDIDHIEFPQEELGRESECLTLDEFIGTVQKEAGLSDRKTADRAVHGVLRGMKVLARDRVGVIAEQLPQEWSTFWVQA